MEDLALRWKKLSFSEVEGKKHDLTKEKKTSEYVLAAKFLTRRLINVEAVARTFRPIWSQNVTLKLVWQAIISY